MADSYLVFISHSSKDKWIARQMARLIEERGEDQEVKTFLDEKDVEGGDSIPEEIRESIQQCDELLVLLSSYSVDRPWVLVEIGAAWGQQKRIVAIIDKISPADMPDVIEQHKAIDLNDFDKYLDHLVARAREAQAR